MTQLVWKTKEEFTAWDWMEYRSGMMMNSKTQNGVTLYQCTKYSK